MVYEPSCVVDEPTLGQQFPGVWKFAVLNSDCPLLPIFLRLSSLLEDL
jgi:hypothetical protein